MPLSNEEEQYLIDSSFVIALMDEKDSHHHRAVEIMNRLPQDPQNVFFSDVVINEVFSVLAKRCEAKGNEQKFPVFVDKFMKFLKPYPVLCLYELMLKLYKDAVDLMLGSQGHLGYHDCLIALFLKEVPRVQLVSFDKDFEKIKFINVLS